MALVCAVLKVLTRARNRRPSLLGDPRLKLRSQWATRHTFKQDRSTGTDIPQPNILAQIDAALGSDHTDMAGTARDQLACGPRHRPTRKREAKRGPVGEVR